MSQEDSNRDDDRDGHRYRRIATLMLLLLITFISIFIPAAHAAYSPALSTVEKPTVHSAHSAAVINTTATHAIADDNAIIDTPATHHAVAVSTPTTSTAYDSSYTGPDFQTTATTNTDGTITVRVSVTGKQTASTHTTINAANIKVVRADSGNNTPLAGATFELYSGTTKIATGSTNASGNIIFDTLVGAGTYTLKEIKAPASYGVAADTTVTITDEQATSNQTVTVDVTSAKNLLAGILPEAGGSGTIWLTIIGVLIVAGSIAGYVRTRKSH